MKAYLFLILYLGTYLVTVAQDNQKFGFKSQPYLQRMTETGVTVMWVANKMCTSYLLFGENDRPDNKALTTHYGLIDANVPVQKIRLDNLTPGKTYFYRAVSVEIKQYGAYRMSFGDTIVSTLHSFTLPRKQVSTFNFLVFNDIHGKPYYVDSVIKANPDFDFAIYNGDIMPTASSEEEILSFICGNALGSVAGNKPFIMVRGNHETRGAEARNLINYIDTPNGQFYYLFRWGNTCFLILDSGEDKEDKNAQYSGLSDFDYYRSEEAEWLKKAVTSEEWRNTDHRIVCCHIPVSLNRGDGRHGTTEIRNKFAPILDTANVDLVISGHTHHAELKKPGNGHHYALVIGGGPEKSVPFVLSGPTYIRVSIDGKRLFVGLYHIDGRMIGYYRKDFTGVREN
ncbi:MAG: FN3 domain-containing metallophosphoesterase family protein [Bacteroidota bacterium]|nr:FN3 domain-containing metallophosphoesterase family protein [Bacteroidota bacterium]